MSKWGLKMESSKVPKDNPSVEIEQNNLSIEESENIDPEPTNKSFPDLISDIENSKQLNNVLSCGNINADTISNLSINSTINQTAETLKNINVIKDELCKLPLDTCGSEYVTTNIFPLVNILYLLANSSYSLAGSANLLNLSPVVHPKKSEIKDTIDLVYDINEQCDDIFKIVKKRLKTLSDH